MPASVRVAVILMWVGAALTVSSVVTAFVLKYELGGYIAQQLSRQGTPYTFETVEAALDVALGVATVSGAVGAVLWILNAVFCARGAAWSRVLATVLGAVYLPGTAFSLIQPSMTESKVILGFTMAVAVAAGVLLWVRSSSSWFSAVAGRAAPTPYGPGRR